MGWGKRNGGPSPGVWGGEEGNTQYTEKAQRGAPLPDRVPTWLPTRAQVSLCPLQRSTHGWSQTEIQV